MPRKLPLYLKQERRRAGFSQADVAYLLGARARTKVSRYERAKHLPPLRTALVFEAMLGVGVSELFPAAFKAARRELLRRARRRADLLERLPETARRARLKRSVERLFARSQ